MVSPSNEGLNAYPYVVVYPDINAFEIGNIDCDAQFKAFSVDEFPVSENAICKVLVRFYSAEFP